MLGCCILPHSASLWGRGTIAPRDGGGGTSGAPPPPRLRFASPRSPGPQMQSHLGEDAAASDAPCIRPLASSPTALRCGGGGPSRLAIVVGGRQRYVPGTSMTGARPQPILRHAAEGSMCRVRTQSSGGSGGRSCRVRRRGLAPRRRSRTGAARLAGIILDSILDSTHAPTRQF